MGHVALCHLEEYSRLYGTLIQSSVVVVVVGVVVVSPLSSVLSLLFLLEECSRLYGTLKLSSGVVV